MNIVVAALKGGVGKTTTCVYLAAIGAEKRPVTLVDADPQASAADWVDGSDDPALQKVTLVEAPTERLVKKAISAADEDDIVIVDTPPGNDQIIAAALERADVVVIPTRVGGVEWPRVEAVRKMVPRRTPHGLVICSARTFTRDYDETVDYWKKQGVPVWASIPERVSVAAGPDRFIATDGIDAYRAVWRKASRA